MTMIRACDHCRNVMIHWTCYNPTTKSMRQVNLNGQLQTFQEGLKMYLKKCCLYAYHFGSPDNMSHSTQQNVSLQLRTNNHKYVNIDNEYFEVFELPNKRVQIIDDPNSSFNPEKIKITRNIYYHSYHNPYKILTKSSYEKERKKIDNQKLKQKNSELSSESCSPQTTQYVYMIQERTAVVSNQSIYKIGRTEQSNFDRFKGYTKGYKILLHMVCDDCKISERAIMDLFKTKYRQVEEYGSEYFEGDYKEMIKDIANIVS